MIDREKVKGKNVISLIEGEIVGEAFDFVIDPEKKEVQWIVVFGERWFEEEIYVINFSKIHKFGKDALTVKDKNVVEKLKENEEALRLLGKGIKVVGARVMNDEGTFIGRVGNFSVEPETGKIAEIFIETGGSYPNEHIITMGKDLIIVKETEADALFHEEVEPVQSVRTEAATEEKEEEGINPEEKKISSEPVLNKADTFTQREISYFVGKKLAEDFVVEGTVVFEKGHVFGVGDLDKLYELHKKGFLRPLMSLLAEEG